MMRRHEEGFPLWVPLKKTMRLEQVQLRSFAKVNFGLQVLGKRGDGFHEIRTLLQTVALHDQIRLTRSRTPGIQFTSNSEELNPTRNLVAEAIRLYQRRMKASGGIRVHLDKNIPIGAGLGGGSGNAAATLWGMSFLHQRPLPLKQLLEWGAELGSDVPFFFLGGKCLGIGRGAEIYPLEDAPKLHILIVVPPFAVSTASAYARLSLKLTKKGSLDKIPHFCSGYLNRLSGTGTLENDFESVVFSDFPQLKKIKQLLIRSGARDAGLSGSGSALYGVFGSRKELFKARSVVESKGIRLIATNTLNRVEFLKSVIEAYR
ncbi:MAG: 4-(cytidine 5'-diphospho)-2-C-methyl-D-erythritol kinase [Terriglobia bacterium]